MKKTRLLTIMRRLGRSGAKLIPAEGKADGDAKDAGAAYMLAAKCTPSERRIAIPADMVRQWLADGLIEPREDGYVLAAAGRSWIKRSLAAGDEFLAQHQERKIRSIDFDGIRRPAIVNDAESPLRWLATRKDKTGRPMLEAFQLEAGERLRADYQFAGLTSKVTSSWNPAATASSGDSGNGAAAHQDNVMAARQRIVRAVAAVGPELAGILVDVCCHLKGLEDAEKTEGWPQRSGKVILQLALTRLARHYGLVSDDQASGGLRRRLSHWGTEDYRPRIAGDGDAA